MTANTLRVAQELVSQSIPIVRLRPYVKPPWGNARGGWDTCNDPDMVKTWLKPNDNLGMLVGHEKGSPVLVVGLDSYKDLGVIDFAKGKGVTTNANVWGWRSGRGGYNVAYYAPDAVLKRDTLQHGSAIDLLVNGYAIIPPSDTSREKGGGGPYRWLKGHSPLDISVAELDTPPKDLLLWWQSLTNPKMPNLQQATEQGHSPAWLTGPIPEGQRNEILTKIAGFYHRKLSDDSLVRHLVHQVNQSQAHPPLSTREVDGILSSILKREGAAHFRGVRPAQLEVVP